MDKKYDFIVSGYSGVNYFLSVDELPRVGVTEIVRNADNSKSYLGGNGINIAYYLAKLGLHPLPIVRVGADCEELGIRRFCRENNISDDAMKVVQEDVTPICYMIENARHEHMVLFYPGAMDGRYAPAEYPPELLTSASYLLMSVASAADNRALLKGAKLAGVPLVFSMKYDPDGFPPDLLREALEYAQIIFMNDREERQILTDLGYRSIRELFDCGSAKVIVVTCGAAGCKVLEPTQETHLSATPSRCVVDTAGAGDSFAAGFLWAMRQGKGPQECAAYGNTVASFVIEHLGCLPEMPSQEQIRERYALRKEKT